MRQKGRNIPEEGIDAEDTYSTPHAIGEISFMVERDLCTPVTKAYVKHNHLYLEARSNVGSSLAMVHLSALVRWFPFIKDWHYEL